MPAIAIECSICLKKIPFRGVICHSTWEPALGEDKISPIYSEFSPDHPQSRIKLELAVWLMIHSSSQSALALYRAIKNKSHTTRIRKKPPPCLTSKQIRQDLGFLTRAQISIFRKYQLLSCLTIQGFLFQWREKIRDIFKSPGAFL